MFGRRGREKKIRQTDPLPCLPLPEVEVSGVRLSPFLPASSDAALFERLTAIVETTTANLNAYYRRREWGNGGGTGAENQFVLPREP